MTAYRKWLFGGIGVAVLVFLIGFLLIVNPARNNAAEIHQQVAEQNDQNVATAAKIEQYRKQSSEVPAKLAEIAAVQQKLPPSLKIPDLVRDIESQAQKAGVHLKSITPGAPSPYAEVGATNASGVPIVTIPLSIEADGGYATIKSFVNGLERMERAYFISGIDVGAEGGDSADLSVSMTGQVFSVPEGSLGLPSASPTPAPGTTFAPGTTPSPNPSSSQTGQAAAKLDKAVVAAKKHRDPTASKAEARAKAQAKAKAKARAKARARAKAKAANS